jgi:hypothetical protein
MPARPHVNAPVHASRLQELQELQEFHEFGLLRNMLHGNSQELQEFDGGQE